LTDFNFFYDFYFLIVLFSLFLHRSIILPSMPSPLLFVSPSALLANHSPHTSSWGTAQRIQLTLCRKRLVEARRSSESREFEGCKSSTKVESVRISSGRKRSAKSTDARIERKKDAIECDALEHRERSRKVEEGREGSSEVEVACGRSGTLAEGGSRNVGTRQLIQYEFILVSNRRQELK
jgi:hypothetical protein